LITQGEKYNKVVDIWAKATDDVANEMMEGMKNAPVLGEDGKVLLDETNSPLSPKA
jgi:DNA-directed RNA polymerase subunit beta'